MKQGTESTLWRWRSSVLAAVLTAAPLAQTMAQDGTSDLLPGVEEISTEDDTDAKEREAALLEAIKDANWKRKPGSALEALAEQHLGDQALAAQGAAQQDGDPERAARRQQVDALRRLVYAGDWPALDRELQAMGPGLSARTYRLLLGELRSAMLLPEEVIRLATLDPAGAPKQESLRSLAQLLRRSLSNAGSSRSLVQQLDRGIGAFGGASDGGRAQAAALFLEAGHILEAGHFLPDVALAQASGDLERIDLHARYLATRATKEGDDAALRIAWELNERLLHDPARQVDLFLSASQRALTLLPLLPPAEQDSWLAAQYGRHSLPEKRAVPLALLSRQVEQAMSLYSSKATPDVRLPALRGLHEHIDRLLLGDANADIWRVPLNMCVMAWIKEARYGIAYATYSYDKRRRAELRPLALADLLKWAPSHSWRRRLDGALAEQVNLLTARLVVSQGEHDQALALIETVNQLNPIAAADLGSQLITVWQNQINDSSSSYRSHGQVSGIPTTRATQTRRLAELSNLAGSLRTTLGPYLDSSALARALIAAHAPAEVFQVQDIRSILGAESEMDPNAMQTLASTMRARLGREWRSPEVHQQAGTGRTTAQIAAQIEHGYGVLDGLLAARIAGEADPRLFLLHLEQALAAFAHAEFRYGQQAPLEVYAQRRDAAFAAIARSAADYRQALPVLPARAKSAQVYLQWFMLAIGTSEASYLTRQGQVDRDQLSALDRALADLGSDDPALEAWHRNAFARSLQRQFQQIPGHSREELLQAARPLCGSQPAGQWIDERLAVYEGLKAELRLATRLTAGSTVGTEPFVLLLGLQATDPVMRETDELRIHLQSQAYVNNETVDYRGDLEDHLRKRLEEHFEIIQLRIADPMVAVRHLSEAGWQELALAAIVLRARDAAVDQIPALRKDLDFAEGQGTLTLAVTAAPLAIDASSPGEMAAVDGLHLELNLDDRPRDDGLISLHIEAEGRGLVPDFSSWLPAEKVGDWELVEAPASKLGLDTIESDGTTVGIRSHRRATWTYRLPADATDSTFVFPTAGLPVEALTRQRHEAMALVPAEASITIPRELQHRAIWPWIAGGVLLALAALLSLVALRRNQGPPAGTERWALADDASAGSLLLYLKRILNSGALSEEQHSALAHQVQQWENRLYAEQGDGSNGDTIVALRRCAEEQQRRLGA